MSGVKVLNPGPASSIQDLGRYGCQHLGMSTGGAIDELSFLLANRLLGNHYNAPCVEMTMGLAKFEVLGEGKIAISGADCDARLNGYSLTNWNRYAVKEGDVLSFGGCRSGNIAYLAVAGGFAVPQIAGACATSLREGVGGFHGRYLTSGDELGWNRCDYKELPCVIRPLIPDLKSQPQLALLTHDLWEQMNASERCLFLGTEFSVSIKSDRMGMRLTLEEDNKVLEVLQKLAQNTVQQVSRGVMPGEIQLTESGELIVLMKDRQTMGGYPTLGCVSKLSLNRLGQCHSRDKVRFVCNSLERAVIEMNRVYQPLLQQ